MTINATFTPGCIPFIQRWLTEHRSQAQNPAALGEIVMQSFGNYVSQFARHPFFHRHDGHTFVGLTVTHGNEEPEELWLAAIRLPNGDWMVGTPDDFTISDQYQIERLIEEARTELARM